MIIILLSWLPDELGIRRTSLVSPKQSALCIPISVARSSPPDTSRLATLALDVVFSNFKVLPLNWYTLHFQDMAPYVPLLMPELKAALIDPLPEVRATAAKALGSLLKGMGQHYFEDVMPWLLETLKSEGSSVERSGAAQGLAEVLAVLGPAHVEALLPEIVDGTKSKSPFVREGHLTLFKFLPLAIPQTFQVMNCPETSS